MVGLRIGTGGITGGFFSMRWRLLEQEWLVKVEGDGNGEELAISGDG